MPRAKRQSDINYNIRRKAQRRIASLERKAETAKTAKERKAAQSQASQLSKQLSQTYQQGKKNKALSRLSESLQGFTPARKRLNTLFKGALRTAGAGGYSRASSIAGEYGLTGKEGTDLFYIVTQRAWEGGRTEDRLQRIMDAYGESDLEALYRRILEENADIMEKLKSVSGDERYKLMIALAKRFEPKDLS